MSIVAPAAGLVTASLLATVIAVPAGARAESVAPAACQERVTFGLSGHQRVFLPVPGARITFTKPGRHTVEIVKASTLSARYGTADAEDRASIRAAVRRDWPATRKAVAVTVGHKETFTSRKGERVTVTYGSRGDRVRWTKLRVKDDCSTIVLDSGIAKFPRRNLAWLFAVGIS